MKFSRSSEWFAPVVMTLGVLTFLALVIGAIFLVRPPLKNVGRSQQPLYEFTDSREQFRLGKVHLSVPKNHVREVVRVENKTKKLILHALLPAFQGYRKDNWWLFENKSPRARLLLIQIEQMKAMISEQTRFQFLSQKAIERTNGSPAGLGLVHYEYKNKRKHAGQDIFTGLGLDNNRLIYFCFRATALSAAPSCSRTFAIALDTALTYKFKRHHLTNWREIEDQIKIFINEIHLLTLREQKTYTAKETFYQ